MDRHAGVKSYRVPDTSFTTGRGETNPKGGILNPDVLGRRDRIAFAGMS